MKAHNCFISSRGDIITYLTVNKCSVEREVISVIGYKKGFINTEIIRIDELSEGYLPELLAFSGDLLEVRDIPIVSNDSDEQLIYDLMYYVKDRHCNPMHLIVRWLTDNTMFPTMASKNPRKDKVNQMIYFPVYNEVYFI